MARQQQQQPAFVAPARTGPHLLLTLLLLLLAISPPVARAQQPLDLAQECSPVVANRLPAAFLARHYELTIEPHFGAREFTGQASISARYTGDFSGHRCEAKGGSSGRPKPFVQLLGDLCRRAFACGGQPGAADPCKRRLLLNVAGSLQVTGVQITSTTLAGPPPNKGPQSQKQPQRPLTEAIFVERACLDERHELLELILERELKADQEDLRIELHFKGKMGPPAGGLFSSITATSGAGTNGSTSSGVAGTYFMPANARRLFPSFDQPDSKATYELRVILDQDQDQAEQQQLVALSSTPAVGDGELLADGRKLIRFAPTPPMATHSLALVVMGANYDSSLTCQAEARSRSVQVSLHLDRALLLAGGARGAAKFALETVCKALPLAERHLKVDFPLDKLDLVLVPGALIAPYPASENWGLILVAEDKFTFASGDDDDDDDQSGSLGALAGRAALAKLLLHALLHQWLGNLAGVRWWDDQWLLDGYIIHKSHLIGHELYPRFNYDLDFLLNVLSPALDGNSMVSSRGGGLGGGLASSVGPAIKPAVEQQADVHAEWRRFVDANVHNKAAAMFQMLSSSLVGESILRDSLAKFLADFRHSTGDARDLFQRILTTSGLNVEPALASWLEQAGLPLVLVRRVAGANELELHQSRLLLRGPGVGSGSGSAMAMAMTRGVGGNQTGPTSTLESESQLWQIPVIVQFADANSTRRELVKTRLESRRARVKAPAWFDAYNPGHWVKLNPALGAFYRVQYDSNLLRRLGRPIERAQLSPADRFQLLDDLRALLHQDLGSPGQDQARQVEPVELVREVLAWFAREQDGAVLSGLARFVRTLGDLGRSRADVRRLVYDLFEHALDDWGFQEPAAGNGNGDEAGLQQLLGRQEALLALVSHEHPRAIEEALRVYDSYASSSSSSPDGLAALKMRLPVYVAVANHGSEEQFSSLAASLRRAPGQQDLLRQLAPHLADDKRKRQLIK